MFDIFLPFFQVFFPPHPEVQGLQLSTFLRPTYWYNYVRWVGCLLSNDVVMNVMKF